MTAARSSIADLQELVVRSAMVLTAPTGIDGPAAVVLPHVSPTRRAHERAAIAVVGLVERTIAAS